MQLLPDDFRVWYEPLVKGRRPSRPDFVMLEASFGLWILETKGWSASEMVKLNDIQVKRRVTRGGNTTEEAYQNPLAQASDYMYSVMKLLQRELSPIGFAVASRPFAPNRPGI